MGEGPADEGKDQGQREEQLRRRVVEEDDRVAVGVKIVTRWGWRRFNRCRG